MEDRVDMFFHRRQTEAGLIGDLFITSPIEDKSRNFLFAIGKPNQMRQTGTRRPGARSGLTVQIFTLEKKMRLRYAS